MKSSSVPKGAFFREVYRIVRRIPRGKVVTYGQIATMLRSPFMARQVGWAMHGCPAGLPWQRVLGAGGRILLNSLSTGEGPLLQRKLLELEGVQFLGSRVDMARHQWKAALGRRNRRMSEEVLGNDTSSMDTIINLAPGRKSGQ